MAPQIGDQAPDFTLTDDQGTPVTLSELRGRNVVLVFYPLAFSPVCTSELKDISKAIDRYDAAGAEVFGISVDSKWALGAFRRDEGIAARLLADFNPKGAVARLYDTYLEDLGFANRSTFVIDKDGRIAHRTTSTVKEARNQEEYLQALAACPV
jgi:mycoredoxin-dependent peroxiredoxin